MKKIFASLGVIALAAMVAAPASAATIDGVADESDARVNVTRTWSTSLSFSQDADIQNNVNVRSNTGGNVIASEDDMEDVSLTTGDATAVSAIVNAANVAEVELEGDESGSGDGDVEITDVDDESTAVINVDESHETEVSAEQTSRVRNHVDTVTRTGANTVFSADDLEGADLETGEAVSGSAIENAFNVLSFMIHSN